jgi:elongation factor Ts
MMLLRRPDHDGWENTMNENGTQQTNGKPDTFRVPAELIRRLRSETGAGISECREALHACDGNETAALEYLKQALASGENMRSDRETSQGRVFTCSGERGFAGVLLRCETDFATANHRFLDAGERCARTVLNLGNDTNMALAELEPIVTGLVAVIKENVVIGGICFLPVAAGERLFSYLHNRGRIAAAFTYTASLPEGRVPFEADQLITDLALQITAGEPLYIDAEDISQEYRQKRREEFCREFDESGKPEHLRETVAAGRLRKHLRSVTLLEQPFVKNPELSVAAHMKAVLHGSGMKLTIKRIARLAVS